MRRALEARAFAWAGGLNTYSRPPQGPTATLRKWTDHRALADSLLSISSARALHTATGGTRPLHLGRRLRLLYIPRCRTKLITRLGDVHARRHVIKEADGPAYRRAVRGPFASPDPSLSACTAFLFDAVKSGTTGSLEVEPSWHDRGLVDALLMPSPALRVSGFKGD